MERALRLDFVVFDLREVMRIEAKGAMAKELQKAVTASSMPSKSSPELKNSPYFPVLDPKVSDFYPHLFPKQKEDTELPQSRLSGSIRIVRELGPRGRGFRKRHTIGNTQLSY